MYDLTWCGGVSEAKKISDMADTYFIPALTGGSVNLFLDAGAAYAGRKYAVLSSITGTTPGTPLPGGTILPLNWDVWTDFVLTWSNTGFFVNFIGTLDAAGKSIATINAPVAGPTFIGLRTFWAFTLYDPFGYVSNPIAIDFI